MIKSINVDEKIWTKLNTLKYKFGCETIGEVINRLLYILTNFKMQEEFKAIGERGKWKLNTIKY